MARVTAAAPVAAVAEGVRRGGYVDWGAIFAGAVLTTAIAFILLAFGSAIGLSFASPYKTFQGSELAWFGLAAALWLIWVQVSSFMAGGYLAGRLRRRHDDAVLDELQIRDGGHGLVVWALGTLIAALIAAILGTGAAKLVQGAAPATESASGGGQPGSPGDLTARYTADLLLRPAPAAPGPAAAAAPTFAPAPGAPPEGAAVATGAPTPTGAAAPSAAPRAAGATEADRNELVRILSVGASRGGVAPEDRAYMAQLIAARTGLAPAEAQQRVDRTLAAADQRARDAADKARKGTVISAFVTVASLLISAAAAFWAAMMGGRDRDAGTVFRLFGRWGY